MLKIILIVFASYISVYSAPMWNIKPSTSPQSVTVDMVGSFNVYTSTAATTPSTIISGATIYTGHMDIAVLKISTANISGSISFDDKLFYNRNGFDIAEPAINSENVYKIKNINKPLSPLEIQIENNPLAPDMSPKMIFRSGAVFLMIYADRGLTQQARILTNDNLRLDANEFYFAGNTCKFYPELRIYNDIIFQNEDSKINLKNGLLTAGTVNVSNVNATQGNFANIIAATTTLRADLTAETTTRIYADILLGEATEQLRNDLTAEINRAIARENEIAISTGTNYADIQTRMKKTADSQLLMGDYAIISSSSVIANEFIGDGSKLTNVIASLGDDLGNHIATTTLNMNYEDIINAYNITATNRIEAPDVKTDRIVPIYTSVKIGDSPATSEIEVERIKTSSITATGTIDYNTISVYRSTGSKEFVREYIGDYITVNQPTTITLPAETTIAHVMITPLVSGAGDLDKIYLSAVHVSSFTVTSTVGGKKVFWRALAR